MIEHLRVDVVQRNGSRLVAVGGELDGAAVAVLAHQLGQLDHCQVTVSLAEVTFIDSSGLRCLLEAYERLTFQGGTLIVSDADPMIRRTFEITGLDEVLFADGW